MWLPLATPFGQKTFIPNSYNLLFTEEARKFSKYTFMHGHWSWFIQFTRDFTKTILNNTTDQLLIQIQRFILIVEL